MLTGLLRSTGRVLRSPSALQPARALGSRALPPIPPSLEGLARPTVAPIEQAKALHPAFYVDEAYVLAERERIFGTQWFAAAHTAELAGPGSVKVLDVGDTSIILTRDKTSKIHAFYNVCRHRGAKVCATDAKDCRQLVCPYHWWAYRLDGSLKSTPPAAVPQQRKEDLGLVRVPGVETFAGIIFLNQLPSPPPLADVLGDLPEKLKRYDLDDMELHGTKDYDIMGDWKLIAENFVDFYHIDAVHPALSKFSKVDNHTSYQGHGQYVGFVTAPLTDSGGPGDSHNFGRFPRICSAESTAGLFFQIFPNVSMTIFPHSVYTLITFPTAAGRTKERLSLLMAPTARKEADCAELFHQKCNAMMEFVTSVNQEDVVAIENLQKGLSNARNQGVHGEFLPQYDWPVHRFQNMVITAVQGAKLNDSIMPKLSNEFESKVSLSL